MGEASIDEQMTNKVLTLARTKQNGFKKQLYYHSLSVQVQVFMPTQLACRYKGRQVLV